MSYNEQTIELLQSISNDLHSIKLLMIRNGRESFMKALENIASTEERKNIWRISDGSHNTKEIAEKVGASLRAVQYFLQDAEKNGLIDYNKRGFPRRAEFFDEIPSNWKPVKKSATVNIPVTDGAIVENE